MTYNNERPPEPMTPPTQSPPRNEAAERLGPCTKRTRLAG